MFSDLCSGGSTSKGISIVEGSIRAPLKFFGCGNSSDQPNHDGKRGNENTASIERY